MSYSLDIQRAHGRLRSDRVTMPLIDMHVHAVDFCQKTDGLKKLLQRMDEVGIDKAIIFGLPVKKKWESYEPVQPHYYLNDNSRCYYFSLTDEIIAHEYQRLEPNQQARLAPLICGFNPTDCGAVDHLEYIYGKYPFWRGVGELLLRHDDLTNLTKEETARVNHPALGKIFTFCIDRDLPLMIHQNMTSVGENDKCEYLHEIKHVLSDFPRLRLVWSHCGISRRVSRDNYHVIVDDMLSNHANLHVDLAWVVYDDVVCDNKDSVLVPKQEWVTLMEKFPDRFMIGSDLCGHFDQLGATIGRYAALLRKLSPATGQRIAFGNAADLWFRK